jgi:amino acid adenylation domain-containing protein
MKSISFEKEVLDPLVSFIEKKPNNLAFSIDDKEYSYKLFGGYISKIINEIRKNCCEESNVGLVINNDIETYASIFALWMEGKCYVPLHPNWPIERCEDIITQVCLQHVMDSSVKTRYKNVKVIDLNGLKYDVSPIEYQKNVAETDLAYILFTSGSTGQPKGVKITRGNVAAFMNSFWETGISISETDRCLQCFDLSFDVSVQSYLVALTRGASVFTVPTGQMKYLSIGGLIEEKHITFGAMAPSVLRYLQPYYEEIDFSSLKQCILTAEAVPMDLVDDWLKYARNTVAYDFYGPTEGTIYSTAYRIKGDGHDKTYNGIVSVGKPLVNMVAIIVDEAGKEVDVGEKGELYIAGPQVTSGYWNNNEKNKTAFSVLNCNNSPVRFYHTGDLCYLDKDGDIFYSGRIDNQAKIQGFRVELSEIEFHARTFLEGKNVVCVVCENEKKLDEILMFVESQKTDTQGLVTYMRSKMPQYMIPKTIRFVEEFPINANGKIDRKKLKSLVNK